MRIKGGADGRAYLEAQPIQFSRRKCVTSMGSREDPVGEPASRVTGGLAPICCFCLPFSAAKAEAEVAFGLCFHFILWGRRTAACRLNHTASSIVRRLPSCTKSSGAGVGGGPWSRASRERYKD